MFKVLTVIIISLTLLAFAGFFHYNTYTDAVTAQYGDTTVIIDNVIIANCGWARVELLVQDPTGAADSVVSHAHWAYYDADGDLLSIDHEDSIAVADSGTTYVKDNFPPKPLGIKAKLVLLTEAKFRRGAAMRVTPTASCYGSR